MANDPDPPHEADIPAAPRGELSLRTLAMPADTNQNGDIFGGWLLSQMDIAGGIFVGKTVRQRCVTVAIQAMTFRKPVFVGDVVSVYTEIVRIGRTSIMVRVDAWVSRSNGPQMILVTDGTFTYVAIDENGDPTPVTTAR
jgi:acyl-CoA thioesterase YciA